MTGNADYHTFVFGRPLFKQPVRFEKGEVVVRDNRFHLYEVNCSLLPSDHNLQNIPEAFDAGSDGLFINA